MPGGAAYDRLALTGTGTLDVTGGNLAIADQPHGGVGDTYFIVTNDGAAQWQITYAADVDTNSWTGGSDIALRVVPEPGMVGVIGLAGLGLLRRRRVTREAIHA